MKRIAIGLGVLTVLVLAGPSGAELCEKCKGKAYIMSVGKCVECGGFTGSGAHNSWLVGKNEGDALKQVGKVKYVSDQPPMPAGDRGRGLMMHRVSGGGKYVFTFTAKKAGTAKLTLEYKRGWEKKTPVTKS